MNLTRPVVVVDRRTYRIAQRKIPLLMEHGDYTRAKSAITATGLWLRSQVRTGPRRHRVRYAADLEQLDLAAAEVNQLIGLVP
jgi:hypothetical protein